MEKVILGIVGEMGSGKDTVANYIVESYRAHQFRFADPLRQALGAFFDTYPRDDMTWLFLEFKKRFGEDVLFHALKRHIESTDGLICVNGLRFQDDLTFIRSLETNYILYVTAPQKLRWERTKSRGEKSDDKQSFEQFVHDEAKLETEFQIPQIGEQADFKIVNNTDLNELFSEVDRILEPIVQKHSL